MKKIKVLEEGFTLTELLIVIVILGILAAVAVPRFYPQAEKSRIAEALGILGAIRQGEESYLLEYGTYCYPTGSTSPVCNGGWGGFGMAAPISACSGTAPPYFTYTVTSASASAFTAQATRCAYRASGLPAAGGYSGTTITINQAGTIGGNHPLRPQ